jgi:hypothetical protein
VIVSVQCSTRNTKHDLPCSVGDHVFLSPQQIAHWLRLIKMLTALLAVHSLFAVELHQLLQVSGPGTNVSSLFISTIRDVIYQPDGRPFNGTIRLEPKTVDTAPPPLLIVTVVDGMLFLKIQTTVTSPGAIYDAKYLSRDSRFQWVEVWHVPQSDHLTLNDVRMSRTPFLSSVGVKGTDDYAGRTVNLPLTLAEVDGLNSALNSINNSLSSISKSALALNTAVGVLASTQFVRGEVPMGLLNGTNAGFTLAGSPVANSVIISLNGLRLNGSEYSVSGRTVTFGAGSIPALGDVLEVDYEVATANAILQGMIRRGITLPIPISGVAGLGNALNQMNSGLSSLSFELASINTAVASLTCPILTVGGALAGALDGTNATFTIGTGAVTTVSVYSNGMRLTAGVDYVLNGSAITFVPAAVPQILDVLAVDYCSK